MIVATEEQRVSGGGAEGCQREGSHLYCLLFIASFLLTLNLKSSLID